MSEAYLAAAVQMCSGESKEANLKAATRQVERAAQLGARVVALPELFNCLGRTEIMLREAEEIPGPTSEAMSELARRLGIVLVAGSICERDAGAGKVFNTCLLIDSSGQLQARYRKMHLFDIDLPGQVSYQESSWLSPGDEVVAVPTELGCFGLSICYDLRFPELYRRLVEAGAELLMVPAAFTLATGKDHWQVLLRSRAIENQAFVIAPQPVWATHTPVHSIWPVDDYRSLGNTASRGSGWGGHDSVADRSGEAAGDTPSSTCSRPPKRSPGKGKASGAPLTDHLLVKTLGSMFWSWRMRWNFISQ